MMKNEIWKTIDGFDNYQISNLGRVKSLRRNRVIGLNKFVQEEKILKQHIINGYSYVYLSKESKIKGFRVHRLVAKAFIDNPNNYPCINHKNEIKTDNNVENLEYCTNKYNNNYGNFKNKIAKTRYKIINQYDLQGNFIKKWNSIKQASEELNIIESSISKCLKGIRNKAGNYIWRYENEKSNNIST